MINPAPTLAILSRAQAVCLSDCRCAALNGHMKREEGRIRYKVQQARGTSSGRVLEIVVQRLPARDPDKDVSQAARHPAVWAAQVTNEVSSTDALRLPFAALSRGPQPLAFRLVVAAAGRVPTYTALIRYLHGTRLARSGRARLADGQVDLVGSPSRVSGRSPFRPAAAATRLLAL